MLSKFNIEIIETFLLSILDGSNSSRIAMIIRGLLRFLSWIFNLVVQIRLWLYKHRILRGNTLGCQVISVGNLTVGGTGKTPVVEVFARNLEKQGRKVAILSRGYKSRSIPLWQKLWLDRLRSPAKVAKLCPRARVTSST